MTTPTPYCESVISWIESVLSVTLEALNFLIGINWWGWANSYITELEGVIKQLEGNLATIKADDCAEIDTIISWVETIAGWVSWLLTL